MKYSIAILFPILMNSCQTQEKATYEEALGNCNRIQEEKKNAHPNGFSFVGAECLVGAQIPEFEAISMDGIKINKELLKGKPTIINFWFISCSPCVAEIPGLNSLVEKYKTNQINYIAIGRDDKQDIAAFLRENPWNFVQIPNGNQIIQDNFKIRWGYPTTFLLNKNAEIVLAFSGGKSDSTAVEEIQNKLMPAIERELK